MGNDSERLVGLVALVFRCLDELALGDEVVVEADSRSCVVEGAFGEAHSVVLADTACW